MSISHRHLNIIFIGGLNNMNHCANGYTDQEDCDDCGYCYTHGYTDCLKGLDYEDCDLCGVCRFY